jgi:hypothetical protein
MDACRPVRPIAQRAGYAGRPPDHVRQIPAHARDGDLKIRDPRLDLAEPLAVVGLGRTDSTKVLNGEAFNPVGRCRPSTTLTTW